MIITVRPHPHVGKMLCCFQRFCRFPMSCCRVHFEKQKDFPKSENVITITNNLIRTLYTNDLCFSSSVVFRLLFYSLRWEWFECKISFLIPLSLKTDIFLRSWTVSKPQEIYFNKSETWAKLSSRFSIWRMDLCWGREAHMALGCIGEKMQGYFGLRFRLSLHGRWIGCLSEQPVLWVVITRILHLNLFLCKWIL